MDSMERNTKSLEALKSELDYITADIDYAVARDRSKGRSWAEIGKGLGMSKQAAQQRYGTRVATLCKTESYHCGCGWTCSYPVWDYAAAQDDITDHEYMHQDEDDRAADSEQDEYGTEPADLETEIQTEIQTESADELANVELLSALTASDVTRRFYDRAKSLGLQVEVSFRAENDQLSVFVTHHRERDRGMVMLSQFPGRNGHRKRHLYSHLDNPFSSKSTWKPCSYAKAVQFIQILAS